jgi:Tfp pilus assembly protein PilN
MDVIDRIWSWVIYTWSTFLMSIGMMTQREWLAAGGLVIGLIAAALGEIHRRRVARTQETTNALLAQLITAVRSDAENRQDVKKLISELKGGHR